MTPRNIDLSYLQRLYKGDRARVEQWIGFYLEEAPAMYERLKVSMEQGDEANLVAAAHDLRPQAHYLGTPRLLELLMAVGERARMYGAPACTELVNEVLTLGDAVAEELRAAIASKANTKPV